jgi:hypothetical protein
MGTSSLSDAFSASASCSERAEGTNPETAVGIDGEYGEGKEENADFFPFLSLPLELRLKIYSFLFPPRIHKIASQYPHNGVYYTAQVPNASQTLYPAGLFPAHPCPRLTTYTLLSANTQRDFPSPSIHPQILRTCRRVRGEAEPVLYGAAGAVFDFGTWWGDALVPFWRDRSARARASVRCVALEWEIPRGWPGIGGREVEAELWMAACAFLRTELPALRSVELGILGEGRAVLAAAAAASLSVPSAVAAHTEADADEIIDAPLLYDWEWTRSLLSIEALQNVEVMLWDFDFVLGEGEGKGKGAFKRWVLSRMGGDGGRAVTTRREKRVWEGKVLEVVVVLGSASI